MDNPTFTHNQAFTHNQTSENLLDNYEPGDINDIAQEIPNKEKLDKLKTVVDSLSGEDTIRLLENFVTTNDGKNINPNNNKFSSASKKEMQRRKYKQILEQKYNESVKNSNNKPANDDKDDEKEDSDNYKKFSINGVD